MAGSKNSPKRQPPAEQASLDLVPHNGESSASPDIGAEPQQSRRRAGEAALARADRFISELGPDSGYARKPVEAIVIRPIEGRLTTQARRWYNVLLRNAQVNPPQPGQRVRMPLSSFYKDARQEGIGNEYLSEVLNVLVTTPIEWGDSPKALQGKRYKWSTATLLSFASIAKGSTGKAELVYDFDPEVKALMLQPEVYAKVALEVVAKMSSHAALFLYELGSRYYSPKSELSSKELPWKDWVVPMTGSSKVNVDKLLYKTFARDTLKPALLEVNNDLLDLPFTISAETRMIGRKVEKLRFTVQPKRSAATPTLGTSEGIQLEVEHLSLIGRLIAMGVPQADAMRMYESFGHERVRAAIESVERRKATDPIDNPVSYFRKVLKTAKSEEGVVDVESKMLPPAPVSTPSAAPSSINAAIAKKYQAEQRDEAVSLFEEGTDDMKEEAYARFEQEGLPGSGDAIKREWASFRKKGRAAKLSPLVKQPFFKWYVGEVQLPDDNELLLWATRRGYITYNLE